MRRPWSLTRNLLLFDFLLLRFVGGNPEGTQEAAIVGADLEITAFGARGLLLRSPNFGEGTGRGAIHESDYGFERNLHLETGGSRPLPACLDPRIFGSGGSNGVG